MTSCCGDGTLAACAVNTNGTLQLLLCHRPSLTSMDQAARLPMPESAAGGTLTWGGANAGAAAAESAAGGQGYSQG